MSPERAPRQNVWQRAAGVASRLGFTLTFLAIMLVVSFTAGSFTGNLPHEILEAWGIGRDSVASGDAFRLVTGIFLSHDPGMLMRQLVFAGGIIGYTEWRRGGIRTAALFFGLDLAGSLVLLTLVGWVPGLAHLAASNDVGMSVGGFGMFGLAAAGCKRRWLVLGLVLLAIGAKYRLSPDPLADLGHLLAFGLGFATGSIPLIRHHTTSSKPGHAR